MRWVTGRCIHCHQVLTTDEVYFSSGRCPRCGFKGSGAGTMVDCVESARLWTGYLCRHVEDGERVPPWYRIAYEDVCARRRVAYPIGIHLVARFCRRVWGWSHRYKPGWLEKQLREAESRGYNRAMDQHGDDMRRELRKLDILQVAASLDRAADQAAKEIRKCPEQDGPDESKGQ